MSELLTASSAASVLSSSLLTVPECISLNNASVPNPLPDIGLNACITVTSGSLRMLCLQSDQGSVAHYYSRGMVRIQPDGHAILFTNIVADERHNDDAL
jgi:hypothetical protein